MFLDTESLLGLPSFCHESCPPGLAQIVHLPSLFVGDDQVFIGMGFFSRYSFPLVFQGFRALPTPFGAVNQQGGWSVGGRSALGKATGLRSGA